MVALTLQLPESLHIAAREVAEHDGVSLDQLVTDALAEKIAAMKTVVYLKQRAQGADENDWPEILSHVPDTEPADFDRLPSNK